MHAIHTYSGYEEKVAEAIRQRADSLDMADKIFQVLVPKEKQIEIKNGKDKKSYITNNTREFQERSFS